MAPFQDVCVAATTDAFYEICSASVEQGLDDEIEAEQAAQDDEQPAAEAEDIFDDKCTNRPDLCSHDARAEGYCCATDGNPPACAENARGPQLMTGSCGTTKLGRVIPMSVLSHPHVSPFVAPPPGLLSLSVRPPARSPARCCCLEPARAGPLRARCCCWTAEPSRAPRVRGS